MSDSLLCRTQNFLRARSRPLILLSVIYLLISLFLFSRYGIKIVNDSPRFLGYATRLQDGFYFDPLNFWYITYAILIYLHHFFSASLLPIIVNQYLLGYLAVIALYEGTRILTEDRLVAFLASFLFIVFPDNIYWHSYILTESIYSSFLCFSFYALARFINGRSRIDFILLLLCVLICFFCKPTSPVLVLAMIAPAIVRFLMDPSYRILKIGGLVTTGALVLVLANQMITMHEVMLIYSKGDIIFAIHELPGHRFNDLLSIDPPTDLHIPDPDVPMLLKIVSFIVNNPIYWLKLFTSKLLVYLTHIRPYWSWMHNLVVVLLIWPSYYFAILAIRKGLIPKTFVIGILTYFSLHTLIICNTWVDWDARFFVPLYPALAVLSAIGISDKIIKSKSHFYSK